MTGAPQSSSVFSLEARLEQHEFAVARNDDSRSPASSLSPSAMRSRTRRRRSLASSALESSIDWFWQTMQRSSRRNRSRARFERRIGQHLVGIDGEGRRGGEAGAARAQEQPPDHSAGSITGRSSASLCRLGAPTRRRRSLSETQPPSHHEQRAAPDAEDERLPPDAHDHAAVIHGVAERDVELAQAEGQDAGLGRRHAAGGIEALGGRDVGDGDAAAADGEMAAILGIVRADCPVAHAVETQRVAAEHPSSARLHLDDVLGLECRDRDDAEHA